MRRVLKRWVLLGIVLATAFYLPALHAQGEEKIIMKVTLNTEDKGELFLFITPSKEALLTQQDLGEIGLEMLTGATPVELEGEHYVPLTSLAPDIQYAIDDKTSTLHITADPKLLKKNVLDFAQREPGKTTHLKANAAFINYNLGYELDDKFRYTSLNLPFEAGININERLFYSGFSYAKSPGETKFSRLFSNVTFDDIAGPRRVVIGDYSASSGILGSGGNFGGVSITRNFALTPYFVTTPTLGLKGMIQTPSEVQVYVNGMLVRSEKLSPGEFEFQNINATGSGDAELVIKDAYGKEERVKVPFYLSSSILKPGVQDYGYSLGVKRQHLGQENFSYKEPTFVGFHRLGLTDNFTAGLRAEMDKDTFNAGGSLAALLGRAGALDAAAALSKQDGRRGYAGTLNYSFSDKSGFSARFSANRFSLGYANLTLQAAAQSKTRLSRNASLSYNHQALGSISASYTQTDYFTQPSKSRTSIFYTRRLFKDVSLYISGGRTKADTVTRDLFIGFNFLFGQQASASINRQRQDDQVTDSASFQSNAPTGIGSGYRFNANRQQDTGKVDGNGSYQYKGSRGIVSADVWHSNGQNRYTLNGSGGIAFINKSFYLSRPIYDSFALVKVGAIENVRVSSSSQEIGTTDKNGEVLVPNLISNYDNELSIDDKDIPVNYDIIEVSKNVSTSYRGAGIVNFDTAKLQGFGGLFSVTENGAKKPAEYWGIEINQSDKTVTAVIGKAGEFYLENLASGQFSARLFLGDKACRFDIDIPASDAIMIDMGEVNCEIH
ncbi:MAG: fimbrial biogenesis outer membrane usher protein [Sideroxydans sp.]|nr:fimbrial biogenesis outer membrane usher protein [Sideroxydans sp.]